MKEKTGIIVVVAVVALIAIGAAAYASKQKPGANTTPGVDANNTHNRIQDWITGALTGTNPTGSATGANGVSQHNATVYELNTLARGGAHGVPDTIENAKQYVFRKATAGATSTNPFKGVWSDYSYPGIEQYSRASSPTTVHGTPGIGGVIDIFSGIFGATPIGAGVNIVSGIAGLFK